MSNESESSAHDDKVIKKQPETSSSSPEHRSPRRSKSAPPSSSNPPASASTFLETVKNWFSCSTKPPVTCRTEFTELEARPAIPPLGNLEGLTDSPTPRTPVNQGPSLPYAGGREALGIPFMDRTPSDTERTDEASTSSRLPTGTTGSGITFPANKNNDSDKASQASVDSDLKRETQIPNYPRRRPDSDPPGGRVTSPSDVQSGASSHTRESDETPDISADGAKKLDNITEESGTPEEELMSGRDSEDEGLRRKRPKLQVEGKDVKRSDCYSPSECSTQPSSGSSTALIVPTKAGKSSDDLRKARADRKAEQKAEKARKRPSNPSEKKLTSAEKLMAASNIPKDVSPATNAVLLDKLHDNMAGYGKVDDVDEDAGDGQGSSDKNNKDDEDDDDSIFGKVVKDYEDNLFDLF